MLSVIVVSQRVGAIKPSPRIFAVAATELDLAGDRILHLGDDWTADVVGARCAGWRAGFLRGQETDWPRQPIDPAVQVTADLVIDRLDLLEGELDRWRASAKDAGAR
jgi:FMN phosphatase YigB (HAD superfamily)